MALPSAQTTQPTGVYLDASYYANAAKLTAAADQSYAAEQLALQQYKTMSNFEGKSSGATYNLATQQGKAAYELANQQALSRFNLDTGFANENYNAELRWREYLKPLEIRNTAEGMMGSGLLRSGYHNRTQREDEAGRQHYLEGLGREKTQGDKSRTLSYTQAKAARSLDYSQAMAALRLQKTQADEARAIGLSQEEARRAMTMQAIASQLGLDLGIESAASLSRYTQAKIDAARFEQSIAPQPEPGSTAEPAPTRQYDQATIDKAKRIVNNKRDYGAAAIAWAEGVLYG